MTQGDSRELQRLYRHWGAAVGISTVCGAVLAFFVGGQAPVPIPGEAHPLFWIGWGPLAAIGIVAFLAVVGADPQRLRWCVGAAALALVAGVVSGLAAWDRADNTAALIALHLPFVCWATVAMSVSWGRRDRERHLYAFIVQSMEVLVTGGIYLAAGGIFGGLTFGIFAVLGVELSESLARVGLAFGIGIIPVLAVASVYDPTVSPAEQSPTGLARILRVMSWLLLPVALAVLALYVFWFIPSYFSRAFEDREVLIVYNATTIAILTLVTAAVSGGAQRQGARVLRIAVLSLGTLTLLLNVYSLAAIVSRIAQYGGLTPNRHAVLGWNTVTVLMLALLLARSRWTSVDDWLAEFRVSLARAMVLPIAWAAWVVFGLPLI